MFYIKTVLFSVCFLLFILGCTQKRTLELDSKKNNVYKKNKKQVDKKDIKNSKNKSFKQHKDCAKHIKVLNYSSSYILKEFQEAYFLNKDIIGAKAQLFLVENRSPSIFAVNINKAVTSYSLEYKLLKKHKCKVSSKYKFYSSAMQKVKNTISSLEKKIAKENLEEKGK